MLKHLVILSCALAGFFLLARGVVWYGPYVYDEADYMYAVSEGWTANAFDTPSMPLRDFIQTGLGRGRDPSHKGDLSSEIRGSNDVLFYRHWHGPLYGYWLALTQGFTTDSRVTRMLNYAFAFGAGVTLYFGALWVLDGAAGQIAAILALVLYLWSYPVLKSAELAPHQLFAYLVAGALLLLAKMFGSPEDARRYWYAAVVVSALAFCVLEVAFALILTTLICGWAARETLKPDLAFALRSLGAFVGSVLIVWPAAVLKLSPIKSYLFMAYLAVFRKAAWGDNIGLADTWQLRLLTSPVLWILLAAGVGYFLKQHLLDQRALKPPGRGTISVVTPFAIFSALMFLATVRVTTNVPRYELPLLPGIILWGSFDVALALAAWTPVRRQAAVAIICAAMLIASWPAIRSKLADPAPQTETIMALVRDNSSRVSQVAGGQRVLLVPNEHLPMVHYYFPELQLRAYYEESEIPGQVRGGGVAGVITRNNPPRFVAIP